MSTSLGILPDITTIDDSYVFPASNNGKTYRISLKRTSDYLVGKESNTKILDYTITYQDQKAVVVFQGNQGSSSQVLLPDHASDPIPVGASIDISNYSLGSVRIVGMSGVEVNSAIGDYVINYGIASITKIENNKWLISGDLMTTSDYNWPNAKTIVDRSFGTAQNGIFTINGNPTYCLMDTILEGGGWMLAMKATRGTTFNYNANYWTTNNTLNPTDTTRNDADAKYHIFNTYVGTQVMAIWPDVGVVGGNLTAPTYGWIWKADISTPATLLSLFQTNRELSASALSLLNMNTAIWSSQSGYTRYGFNMSGNLPVRWGFIWNNENNSNSSDASGGIGMSSGASSYSAGDWYSSGGVQGLNRSMRVEIYIR